MGIFKQTKEEKKTSAKKVADKTTTKAKAAPKKSASMKDLYEGKKQVKTVGKDQEIVAKKGLAYKILVKPLITEKAASMSAEGKYVFAVSVDANKIEIKNAVFEVYGVRPVAVNVINMLGKKVRFGKSMGKRKDWRKAIITLAKGETINIYEGV